jgi:serine/threonine-protein kinase RsbW
MSDQSTSTIHFDIQYSPRELDGSRLKLVQFLGSRGISGEETARFELVFYEVAINVIEHTMNQPRGEHISIDCTVSSDMITLSITDTSASFDPTSHKLPDINTHFRSGRKGGLGIYIIRTLMDSITYRYADGKNILILGRKRG